MAGCYDDVQGLLTSVNGPDKHIRIVYVGHPDAMWRSSVCYVCECRVPLLEGVRIGEACHVYPWGNPDGGNPDENACHVSSGSMCHVSSGGGVPTGYILDLSEFKAVGNLELVQLVEAPLESKLGQLTW